MDDPRPNVIRSMVVRHGDPDAAGEVSVEGVYDIGTQDQAFLGPESGLAVPDGEGGVDVYVATQWLHVDRDQVAPCLGLEPEQVRIHLAGVGGAFGGREDLSMQIHGAMLALHAERPVKMVYSREESFTGHVHRHPARIWAEHRATLDGRLVNVRMRILLDGGAYASSSTAVVANACAFACGPYRVDNALIEGTVVYSNNPPCGAMRGFGAVQTCFAHEAQMDRLAAALDIDPVELRLLNALEPGDVLPTGQAITGSFPVAEVIRRAAALDPPEPEELPRDPMRLPGGSGNTTHGQGVRRGSGFAVGFKNICYSEGFDDSCAARVRLFGAGGSRAEVACAAAEVGQGVTNVIAPGRANGARYRRRRPRAGLDGRVGSAGSASASRMTWMAAGAVQLACRAALEERQRTGGDVDVERVYHHSRTWPLDPETGQITDGPSHVSFACAAMRVVAEVDVELGLTRLVWIGTAQDIGKAINPQAVHGQIEGGTAQGIGLALMEEIQTRDGLITNASFTDYLIPTFLDVPPLERRARRGPRAGRALRAERRRRAADRRLDGRRRRGAAGCERPRADARPRPARRRRRPVSLARRIAVARGDEPADLVVRGGRVLSVFTREWLDADVAVCDGYVAGLGEYDGARDARRLGPVRRPRLHRRAHAPRVDEAPRRRVRAARAAARDDRRRRRPARDRERARHGRRALAARRLRRAAARRLLHGLVVRAGLAVRVAAAAADARRPAGAAAPPPRARPRRDDELPRRHRRRRGASWRSWRWTAPSTSTATRPECSASASRPTLRRASAPTTRR